MIVIEKNRFIVLKYVKYKYKKDRILADNIFIWKNKHWILEVLIKGKLSLFYFLWLNLSFIL